MRRKIIDSPLYTRQQKVLNDIGRELGIVVFRPDYHADKGDNNTVLFYTKEDHEFNRALEKSGMDRVGGFDRTKPGFFYFENSDVNGRKDYSFANRGSINLASPGWEKSLRGAVELAYYKKLQTDYVRSHGGYLNIREADDTYNELNRHIIKAFAARHGKAYLGCINYHDEQREGIVSGNISVYEEYDENKQIYNFDYSFIVPVKDERLQQMIRDWNRDSALPKKYESADRITSRVEKLGGINFVWY